MAVVGWITWCMACIIALAQLPLMKEDAKGVRILAVRFFVLLLTGIIITLLTSISKLHLLWWVPLSYLMNVYLFRFFNSCRQKK
jgi:hypothetical protein